MKKTTYIAFVFLIALTGNTNFLKAQSVLPEQAATKEDSTTVAIHEVVIQENRFRTRFSQVNRSIRILDRQLIEALPVRNLNEVLGHATGVDLRQRGPFGAQADVSIDGGTFEQTVILLNGVKMLDAQTAHHGLNLPLPLENIERIEVLRGPAARIYGVNSLTGAINIITRRPEKTGIRIHSRVGSSLQRAEELANNPLYYVYDFAATGDVVTKKQHQHTASLQHASGNGHRYNSGIQQYRLYLQSLIPLADSSSFTVMGGWIHNDFGANGFYAAPGDRESQEIVQTTFGMVSYTTQLHPRLRIRPVLSYRRTYDDYRYDRRDLSRARSEHQGYTLSPELHATYQLAAGEMGFGLEWRREHIRSSNIGRHERDNFGGYAEYKTTVLESVSINAGMYVNYHSDYGWQWFPGADFGLDITEKLRWTMHAGTGKRIPSFTDLYLDQKPGNMGNPEILPERAWQLESGFKYTSGLVHGRAHYFFRNIDQFIDWVHPQGANPPYQPLNFENNQVHGWSAAVDRWFGTSPENGRWRGSLQYTYLHPSHHVIENYVSKYSLEILRQQWTGHLLYQHHNWSAALATRWQERSNYKSYFLSDLRLGYAWNHLALSLDVNNAFDTHYQEAGAVPLPGRWYSLGIKFMN